MKKIVLISIFVFIFSGCGGSGDGEPQYKAGDSIFIIKNIKKSIIPLLKDYFKERLAEESKGLPIVFKFKNYESESCISFGFKFQDVETKDKLIQTNFTKDDNSKCIIQDHSIGDALYRGNSGLVIFVRIP